MPTSVLGDSVGEVGAVASRAGPHGSGDGAALTLRKERRRLVDLHLLFEHGPLGVGDGGHSVAAEREEMRVCTQRY